MYFITICTFEKQSFFTCEEAVKDVLCCLKQEADGFLFTIYAYCFMPDHLHLLLISDEDADLVKFMKMFKQKSSYYFKKQNGKKLWQGSYFDHVIRKEKQINDIAGYIFYNPVRKKMVDDFREYPYLGSFMFELDQFYEMYAQKSNIDIDLMRL
ncbi:MAG: transposase [Candidatus Margulisiibacteriota bacterium]